MDLRHEAQIARRKPQRGIHPDLDHIQQFFAGQRIDPLTNALDGELSVAGVTALTNEIVDGMHTLAVRRQHVHHAHVAQFPCPVLVGRTHQAFRPPWLDAPGQQAVATHAREQVEQHLGETQLRVLFGDQDIGRQRALESAAQRHPLHQRDRGQRRHPEVGPVLVHHVDAIATVVVKTITVSCLDQLHEQFQIAAEAEDRRIGRGEDQVLQFLDGGRRIVKELPGPFLYIADFSDQGQGCARPVGVEVTPQRGAFAVMVQIQLGIGGEQPIDDKCTAGFHAILLDPAGRAGAGAS